MYKIEAKIKLPDTDAAGILFYANYFKLAHDVYESFMDDIGYSLRYVLQEGDVLLLIAHAESDYKSSFHIGDKYEVHLKVEKMGRTSFVLAYRFYNGSGELNASLKTVHVAVDKKSQEPVALPENLHRKLADYT
jgi:1,4-dihydroxy-2-naphthoyl-CoA hydrolase